MPSLQSASNSVLPRVVQEILHEATLSSGELDELNRLFLALKEVKNTSNSLPFGIGREQIFGSLKSMLTNYLYCVGPVMQDRCRSEKNSQIAKGVADKVTPDTDRSMLYRVFQDVSDAVIRVYSGVSQLKDPLVFPVVSGTPIEPVKGELSSGMNFVELNDRNRVADFLALLNNMSSKGSDAIGSRELLEDIKEHIQGKEILLALSLHRKTRKRAAIGRMTAIQNEAYRTYIEDHCRIRTKTMAGTPVGDNILIASEYFRNPFRALFEKIGGVDSPGYQLGETETTMTEIINLSSDVVLGIFTAGAYPIVKYGAAKALSITGQAINGDTTCIKKEFSPEELANLLFDTEVGLTDRLAFHRMAQPRPAGLPHANTFKPSGAFIQEHVSSGIHTEKHLTIIENGMEVRIREKKPGEYVAYHPRASQTEQAERRVYFDQAKQRVFFEGDSLDSQGFEFNVIDGRKFINVDGVSYELNYNWKKQRPEVKINTEARTELLPVYMEKISRTWHMDVHHARAAFVGKQKKLLENIRVDYSTENDYQAVENLNPQIYGKGKIYEVRPRNTPNSVPARLRIIEMHGDLVPVRLKPVESQGIYYEVYDEEAPESSYPIEWDGSRWTFERATSSHVSKKLKNAISPDMIDKTVSAQSLSGPDQKGLRWGKNGKSFIKIKNGFVPIQPYKKTNNAFYIRHAGRNMNLIYKNRKFIRESIEQRIHKLWNEGLSGRGSQLASRTVFRQRTPVEIIQDAFSTDADGARNILNKYRFDKYSTYDELDFALYIEAYGEIPHWAERYERFANVDDLLHQAQTEKVEDLFSMHKKRPKQRTPVEIIEDAMSLNADQANDFLKRYHFEKGSLRDEMSFALEIEQNGEIPSWAKRIEPDLTQKKQSDMTHSVTAHDSAAETPSGSKQKRYENHHGEGMILGDMISRGLEGEVYNDAGNDFFVIKKFNEIGVDLQSSNRSAINSTKTNFDDSIAPLTHLSLERRRKMAQRQASLFQRYYGDNAARVFVDKNNVYLRMYKIPGQPLLSVRPGTLPENAIERFVDMLEKLNNVGIWHGDLNSQNIMYDASDNIFYPIDFSNVRDQYFAGDRQAKELANLGGENAWFKIVRMIKEKQVGNTSYLSLRPPHQV